METVNKLVIRFHPIFTLRGLRFLVLISLFGVVFHFRGTTSLVLAWVIFAFIFLSPYTQRITLNYAERFMVGPKIWLFIIWDAVKVVTYTSFFAGVRIMGYYLA